MSFSRTLFVGIAISVLLAFPAKRASALIAIGGGIYCNGAIVNGVFEGLVNCFDYGGGGGSVVPDPGGGGGVVGGGGSGPGSGSGGPSPGTVDPEIPPEKLRDKRLDDRLQCAMEKYAHSDVKLGAGQGMRTVDVYAFGKLNSYGEWGYKVSETNTLPAGEGWVAVAGITTPNTAYGRIYKLAFEGGNYSFQGTRNGASNSLVGKLNSFEKSIFVAMHESNHLKGNLADETLANWYGIDAVLKYRADGGKKCPKNAPDTPPK